jgi:hypothetical protein
MNLSQWSEFPAVHGASGLWSTKVGNFRYALVGTDQGLHIQSLDATGVSLDVGGPTTVAGGAIQRDVEVYGSLAYVCSNATGPTQGVLIIDLSGLPVKASVVGAFLPNDADARAFNLSIDTARGLLFLQRSLGVEVWDLKTDPLHPAFITRLASDTSVSDLVIQGSRLYLAEGSANRFSIWDVSTATQATLLAQWPAQGFANSIWPREDGQVIGTIEETPLAPIKFWAVNAQGLVVAAGKWSLDNQTLASSIKLKGDRAYIAYRGAGLVVLGLSDLSKPSLVGRFDGPINTAEPALRDVRDILPSTELYPSYTLVSDGAKGLFMVYTY